MGVMDMPRIVTVLLVLAFAWPAAAQQAGGIPLAPGVGLGPTGLAKLLPFVLPNIGASDIQSSLLGQTNAAAQTQAQAQANPFSASGVGSVGGTGFGFGGPAFSGRGGRKTVIVNRTFDPTFANTFNGPVAFTRGNGNTVQLQSANGSGPIALQQVANGPGARSGGAVNTAMGAASGAQAGGNSLHNGGKRVRLGGRDLQPGGR
jgi:hypothetical protein